MNIILLGPPGAGKGTQAARLNALLNLPHIASGDIFRDIRREDTPLARQVQGYMDRGEYVPDALTIELVLARLGQPDAAGGFILDGFPRTQGQAGALDEAMAAGGQAVDHALYITAPSEILMHRLATRIICLQCHAIYNMESKPPRREHLCDLCGHGLERRSDEGPEVVHRRLETFIRQTEPLIRYYKRQGNLVQIDGARSPDVVQEDIDARLGIGPMDPGLAMQEPA